jgi:carboxymethylenebutenolidase
MNKHIDQNVDQTAIDLYDDFTHGHISRRDFFDRLTSLAGSAGAATAIYTSLRSDYAQAAIVAPDDARLISEKITFDTPNGKVSGTLVRLKDKAKRPAVIAIHENRGLNPHIEDVARRFALEGYLAFAIDLLSSQGGTPSDEDKAREMFGKINIAEVEQQTAGVVSALAKHPESTGKVGIVGFCWGGAMVNRVALIAPAELGAAVAYYGGAPQNKDRVPNIKAPLLLHYAGLDGNINPGIPAYEEALKAAGKRYTIHMYEGVNHAFNNDTGGARYNKEAADLAWSRTIAFFRANLGA